MLIDPEKLMPLAEAGRLHPGYTEAVLRGRIRRGDLEAVQIGRNLYVTEEMLRAFIARDLLTGGDH
ncbi:MAG TPA: hypothetical protein VJX71_02355 [Methylomirabilota bacterium]|nr:hypothetical protein [Methylomirabilota bacterium]